MNDGVTDEQRVAAFRDRYGRVAFAAAWGTTNPDVPRPRWEDVTEFTRRYWGTVAESVVDAFATGDGAPPNSGTIAVDRARLARLVELAAAWQDQHAAYAADDHDAIRASGHRCRAAFAALRPGDVAAEEMAAALAGEDDSPTSLHQN